VLLDTELLDEIRSRGKIPRFECPESLELDASGLQPEESARRIVEHVAVLEEAGKTELII
jgi:hypothetical protein